MTITRALLLALHAHNSGVDAARRAYAADQAVAAGICGTCFNNQLDRGSGRLCWSCLHHIQQESA